MDQGTEIAFKFHAMFSVIEYESLWIKAAVDNIGKEFPKE